VSAQSQKITRELEITAGQSHPRSSVLVPNRKRICNFLLLINSTFGRICCRLRDIDAFSL